MFHAKVFTIFQVNFFAMLTDVKSLILLDSQIKFIKLCGLKNQFTTLALYCFSIFHSVAVLLKVCQK